MSENNTKPAEKEDLLAETRMSFGEHLEELRSRLLKSIYGILIGLGVCLYFGGDIFSFLAQPLLVALQSAHLEPQIYVTSLPESFVTYIKVCFYSGIFLASPWVFYQLWIFVAAGLYPHEKRYVHMVMPFSAILFLLGGAFSIWLVAPLSCSYFIKFGTNIPVPEISRNFIYRALTPDADDSRDSETTGPNSPADEITKNTSAEAHSSSEKQNQKPLIKPWFTLQKYVSLIIVLALAFGVAFQMPLVVFFLGRLSLVRLSTLRSVRKYVFFGIVIISAVMTPPDVLSQIAMAIPMYALYELGLLLLRIWPARERSFD